MRDIEFSNEINANKAISIWERGESVENGEGHGKQCKVTQQGSIVRQCNYSINIS